MNLGLKRFHCQLIDVSTVMFAGSSQVFPVVFRGLCHTYCICGLPASVPAHNLYEVQFTSVFGLLYFSSFTCEICTSGFFSYCCCVLISPEKRNSKFCQLHMSSSAAWLAFVATFHQWCEFRARAIQNFFGIASVCCFVFALSLKAYTSTVMIQQLSHLFFYCCSYFQATRQQSLNYGCIVEDKTTHQVEFWIISVT